MSKNGYQPLAGDDQEETFLDQDPDQESPQQRQVSEPPTQGNAPAVSSLHPVSNDTHANANSALTRPLLSVLDAHVSSDTTNASVDTVDAVAARSGAGAFPVDSKPSSRLHEPRIPLDASGTGTVANGAADSITEHELTRSGLFSRPQPLQTESAPVGVPTATTTTSTPSAATSSTTATADHSSSSSNFLPQFGVRRKTLLGLKDRLSSASTTNIPAGSGSGSSSSYARLVGSKSLASGLLGGGNSSSRDQSNKRGEARDARAYSDLAHIRPKQHPHTTLSGPRGIQRAQKRQVLREIRPDPHNLPEELLREQAKSGAAVEAALGGGGGAIDTMRGLEGDHTIGSLSVPGGAPGSPGSPGGGRERGTLLGSGDGLGLGIGLGGKAHQALQPQPSRWSSARPRLSTRQRRVPSSGLGRENDQRVIQSSVFTPVLVSVDGGQPMTQAPALTPDHAEPMTSERFVAIVDSVKEAIRSGIQPLRIAQGSSGSYFCRNTDGKIVGVFKPKNEEPYGQLNPKWAKWIHRNLFPCCFGRSCLIPNLGYISESATSLVDRRLKLNIVPSTEVVWISSPAFHYDYLDRRAAQSQKGAKPLPDKVGSFQLFLNGFKDANLFMRDHPWPLEAAVPGEGNGKGRYGNWRRSSPESIHSHQEDAASVYGSIAGSTTGTGLAGGVPLSGYNVERPGFSWTPALQQQFKEQFEKMIILDYLIRNTDRGLDNWMIRYCEKEGISIVAPGMQRTDTQQSNPAASVAAAASRRGSRVGDLLGQSVDLNGSPSSSHSLLRDATTRSSGMLATPPGTPPQSNLSRAPSGMELLQDADEDTHNAHQHRAGSPPYSQPASQTPEATMESYYGATHVHVAAIDNGLAFPFKHPDSWRSYPYGWLFLPRPLIAQPFTKATRDHFLPLLSDPVWWRETIADLRRLFSIDSDFDQGMFDKQMAVMKGQGWNIVETLKNLDHGPMDLCRRVAVVVWDEEVTLGPDAAIRRSASNTGLHTTGSTTSAPMAAAPPLSYTSAQPTARTMDAKTTGYANYGSMMTMSSSAAVENRLSSAKTLSTSSTAIGEGTPFLTASLDKGHPSSVHKKPSYTAIDMDRHDKFLSVDRPVSYVSSATEPPRHDSFRQVVSDGEYDLDDEDDYEDDYDDYDDHGFSYEEDFDCDDEEREDFGPFEDVPKSLSSVTAANPNKPLQQQQQSQTSRGPVGKGGMVSIDMTLSGDSNIASTRTSRRGRSESGQSGGWGAGSGNGDDGEAARGNNRSRGHRRRQSHRSEDGRSGRRSRVQSGQPVGVIVATSGAAGEAGSNLATTTTAMARVSDEEDQHSRHNHRRSRTEHDDRTGTIRFEHAAGSPSPSRQRQEREANERTGLIPGSLNPFVSPEDNRASAVSAQAAEGQEADQEAEPERGRGRSRMAEFFSAGYGAIGGQKDGQGEDGRLGERPRWADRLRRGLSFDGHLLTVGIGESARRERKLRKQKQRERELRERRVVLVERIEPVTKNLPYFKWW
ncbi:phosphatidylinositol 4-kinase type 2 [Entomortierella parvispora]|uniref:1-phosphatidylinositol 4-kinase n=1 Tax=Entomortierella parvispora TaxID=205924 RepID=A0A9P3HD71_9FUNG|nr:phosphatidylinositol 4-kinase type 2 [Entomortierella parvispora]